MKQQNVVDVCLWRGITVLLHFNNQALNALERAQLERVGLQSRRQTDRDLRMLVGPRGTAFERPAPSPMIGHGSHLFGIRAVLAFH
ncbi:Hypothetical protein SMAX5B_001399, partial [Scophthalmus maximus]